MDLLNAIQTRVSIRDYKEDLVPEEILKQLLQAAIRAPSGENLQPWRFIVIKDPEIKETIGKFSVQAAQEHFTARILELEKRFAGIQDKERRETIIKSLTSGSRMRFIGTAPLLIVACADKDAPSYIQGVSAAIENMLLTAHALGLGGCWTTLSLLIPETKDALYKLLEIPTNIEIIAVISLGYPSRVPRLRPRKSIDEFTHYNKFGKTTIQTL